MTPNRRARFCVPLGLAALLLFAPAARADSGWFIKRFDVTIEIGRDGTLDVVEKVAAHFDEPKHGIFREIPVRYDVHGHLYDLRMHLKSVDNGSGSDWETSVSDAGNLVSIKVGDPKTRLTGDHLYVIRYRLARAVLWEGANAVLRWNATGTEWRVPIGESSVTVVLPEPLDDSRVQYDAWTGRYGDKLKDFTKRRVDPKTLEFTTGALQPGEGITVEIAMPASAVVEPSTLTQLGWWLADNFVYGLIPAGLAACAGLWFVRGRDLPGHGTVVVNYEPPEGLGPAEAGTLADEKVDLRDVSSILIDLAVRGFLTIEEVQTPGALWGSSTDYAFHKRTEPKGLKPYERLVYDRVFEKGDQVMLSGLRNKFFSTLPEVRAEIYRSMAVAGYFDGNPDSVRNSFLAIGLVSAAAALFFAAVVQNLWIGRFFIPPLLVTGIVLVAAVAVTSQKMPRKTRKGKIAWEQVRGLEEFISRAEVDDLKAQERQGVFERLLPYATAFNLTTRWAKAFEGLFKEPPDWYRTASNNNAFNMYYFGSSIDRSVDAMNATFPSQPRVESTGSSGWSSGGFSGGGSSGGGFGGGGGGSW